MSKSNWYKLDNAAMIFPPSSNKKNSDNFRISITLKEPIDKNKLEVATNKAISHFPTMAVKMKRGFFWKYFDSNDKPVPIHEEKERPCSKIDLIKNNDYHFKILYFKNRISLEMFHAITDGTGALTFLNKIVSYYFGYEDQLISEEEQTIDSYLEHYDESKPLNIPILNSARKIHGKEVVYSGMLIDQGIMSVNDVLSLSKSRHQTITELLLSIFFKSIEESANTQKKHLPITIMVPVNLRKLFSSVSLRNFTYFMPISLKVSELKSMASIEKAVKANMKKGLDKKVLFAPIQLNIKLSQSFLFRLVPYGIKHNILKMARGLYNDRGMTSMLTNLGQISLPESIRDHVIGYDFILGTSSKKSVNMAVCSYKDNLVITLSRNIEENDIANRFYDILEEDYKIHVKRFNNE
ncbi:hypothetical protein EZV73_02840 [Acidaminobacter sp. JC074]|uniref:hypothetical protein n=1 Tax=Acidaminobacter sp. JC074 TaxID=2530199 RepID=UPI001F0D5707|nr:hypothetical protein [Acidaminobacter sp. JC074]MCH4886484.1 hypothetical protein [Acidaminobacter sp. JC074]